MEQIKKKFSSLLPEEIHPPFMNFMGPGTKVEDRLSLNYKGTKGTKNYFIPTSYSDYVSFEHDLLYWSPDNVVKAYADSKFLKDVRSFIGLMGILSQYIKRFGIENFFNYQVLQGTLKNVNTMTNTINNLETTIRRNPNVLRVARNINLLDSIDRQLSSKRPFIELPAPEQKRMLERQLGRQNLLNKIQKIQQREKFKSYFKLLPNILITGYFLVPQIINSGNKLAENVFSLFLKNDEYEIIQKKVDDVKKKYDDYLDVVGEWKDAPWYRSLVAPWYRGYFSSLKHTGEKFFKIKDNIDTEKAKQKYIEFYDEWKKYAEFMNLYYEDKPGYQKFDIKELNKDMLELVSNPTDQPSSYIEQWYKTNPLPSPSLPPPPSPTQIKNITEETETLSESVSKSPPPIQISESPAPSLSPSEIVEITKSLDKISETITPSPTIVPTPTIAPTIEGDDDDDIPIDITEQIKYIEDDDETIIVMPDDIKKEIEAILEKRQDLPFETPIEFD